MWIWILLMLHRAVYCQVIDEYLCGSQDSQIFLDDKCFRCLSSQQVIVPIHKLCDGNIDCPDLSDECLCDIRTRPHICSEIQWGDDGGDWIPRAKVFCNTGTDNTEIFIELNKLCDKNEACENFHDLHCNIKTDDTKRHYCTATNTYVPKCDGIIDCTSQVDEEECQCEGLVPDICREIRLRPSFHADRICDGIVHLPSRVDELSCPGWFYCNNSTEGVFRVSPHKICDGFIDCPDGSDENDCPPFKCNDGGAVKYLEERLVCDGSLNCWKGSDECQEECIYSVFSNTKNMIKNVGVEAVVWFICFTAIIGNMIVFAFTTRDLACDNRREVGFSRSEKINRMLILNLSLSQLLVGVYAIAIASVNAAQRGSYCLLDHDWRSSHTCAAFGVLMVVGSQNSVFTLLLITFARVRETLRLGNKPCFKKYFSAIVTGWVISVFLATIPVIPALEDYFVDSVRYQQNRLFSTIHRNQIEEKINWLSMMHGSNRSEPINNLRSWATLRKLTAEMNPNVEQDEQKYGFYSGHSVCLPTLFAHKETDTAWIYSLMFITINFLSFIVILGGYLGIFRTSAYRNIARADSMQAKLTRIMITDFFCWIPVCIIGFVQVIGVDIPKDAYLPVALIVLPINSSLNPFLYSDAPDYLCRKIKSCFAPLRDRMSTTHGTEAGGVERLETAEDRVEGEMEMNEVDKPSSQDL